MKKILRLRFYIDCVAVASPIFDMMKVMHIIKSRTFCLFLQLIFASSFLISCNLIEEDDYEEFMSMTDTEYDCEFSGRWKVLGATTGGPSEPERMGNEVHYSNDFLTCLSYIDIKYDSVYFNFKTPVKHLLHIHRDNSPEWEYNDVWAEDGITFGAKVKRGSSLSSSTGAFYGLAIRLDSVNKEYVEQWIGGMYESDLPSIYSSPKFYSKDDEHANRMFWNVGPVQYEFVR